MATFSWPEMTPACAVLLDCLHQDPTRQASLHEASFDIAEWDAFFHMAVRHNVAALLYQRLKTAGTLTPLPETIQKALFVCYMENAARNLKSFHCLKDILKVFRAEKLPVIALKGTHLAHTVYKNISAREMSDIDLLVPPEKLEAADKALKSLGYAPNSPSDFAFEITQFAHVPQYNRPASPAIEVHWNIERPKPPCHFDPTRFWQDMEQFQIQDFNAQGLSPEWLLLHVCTHISHHHGFTPGLRSYYDIAETINHYGETLNWHRFMEFTVDVGAKRGVYLALFLARELLGAAVPDETLLALRPSGMNNRIVMMAQNQFLAENPIRNFRGARAEVLNRPGIWPKVRGAFQRLFLPRKMIARIYGLDPSTFYTYLYYPVRLIDLIRRYKKTVWDYTRGTNNTRTMLEGVKFLEDWLAGK